MAARGLRGELGGGGSYCLLVAEFPFCKMKRVLQMDGGDGCTAI